MLLASLQLRAVQASDASQQFQFRDYAGLRILITLLAMCVLLGVGAALYSGETALTIAAFALSKGIESLSDTFYGLWQQQERMDLIAKSLVSRGVLALVAAVVCFQLFHTVWIAVCGIATSWAVVFVTFDVRHGVSVARATHQTALPRFSARHIKQLALLALPLGIANMFISLNANIPRYMISHFRGVSELGIFSALGYIPMAGTIVVGALSQAALPRLAFLASHGTMREFWSLLNRLLLIGLALGTCGVLAALVFGRGIITMIYGREYAQDHRVFVWLMVAGAAGYMASFAGCSLTAARHFRVQLPMFSLLTALTLGLCFVTVRAAGAAGAAEAVAFVGFVQLATTVAVLRSAEVRRAAEHPTS
jgi:O-antigen/teichoic acid export membrane protein